MRCQHGADDQRAEIALHVDGLEQGITAKSQCDAVENLQLAAMPGAVQQVHEHVAHRHQQQQAQCPDRGQLAGGRSQEYHGEDVLHNEDTDRDLAVPGLVFALVFQRFHREHGAGKTQRETDQHGLADIDAGKRLYTGQAHPVQQGSEYGENDGRVQRRPRPDDRAQKRAQIEFQADGEQQQRDPEIADHGQPVVVVHTGEIQHEPAQQVAHHGW